MVLGSEYDRHQSYVAVSRARGETQIFYDQSLLAVQATGEQELRLRQSELTDNTEMAYLAAKLSRANLKTSTLALTGDAEIFREQRRRERDRSEFSI